jgi:hypothetical protein
MIKTTFIQDSSIIYIGVFNFEEEKAGLRSVLSEGEDVAKQLREAEAAKFTAPEELVDQDIISQRVMGTPEVQAAEQAMEQVKNVEQVFGDVLKRGTKETRTPSKAFTTAEIAGTDQYIAKLKDLEEMKTAISKLDPEKAKEVLPKLDAAIEEIGLLTRVGRASPIGDMKTQALGGVKQLAIKGASSLGYGKARIAEEVRKATPESLKAIAQQVRTGAGLAYKGVSKAGATTREAFAAMLDKAAENPDKVARNATLYMLLQDPKYREITEEEK